jgi:hypothetical protein
MASEPHAETPCSLVYTLYLSVWIFFGVILSQKGIFLWSFRAEKRMKIAT